MTTDYAHSEFKLYKSLFDESRDLLAITDINTTIVSVNKRWVDLTGFSEEELSSLKLIDFVHPDDVDQSLVQLESLKKGNQHSTPFQNRYLKKNGEYIWLEWHVVYDKEHEVLYTVARDVTKNVMLQEFEKYAKDIMIRYSSDKLHKVPFRDYLNSLLNEICELFKAEVCSLWIFTKGYTQLECKYRSLHKNDLTGLSITLDKFPSYFNATKINKIVTASLEFDDDVSNELAGYFKHYDLVCLLDTQVTLPSEQFGVICIEDSKHRNWTMEEQATAASFGAVVANAFAQYQLQSHQNLDS